MCAHKACVRLRLAVSAVGDGRGQGTVSSSPVIVRDEVEVLVETALRLLVDDAEDLCDRIVPYSVNFSNLRLTTRLGGRDLSYSCCS